MIDTGQILSAVHTALTGDASLTAVVPATSIGNHLKDETPFPHILYGIDAEDAGIKGQRAYLISLTVEVFSAYRGEGQAWEVHDLVADVLDSSSLSIASGDITFFNFESINVENEGDGRTRKATISYNLMVTEN